MMEYQLWGGHKLKMTADCILGIVGTIKAMGICPAGNSKNHLTNVTSLHHRGGISSKQAICPELLRAEHTEGGRRKKLRMFSL